MYLDNTALAQFQSQLVKIETEILEETYDDIQYPNLIPVDTSGPEWVKGLTYRSMSQIGEAKWINGGAQDVPNADITTAEVSTPVELAAIGYSYTLEEVNQSVLHNFPLETSRISAARRAAEGSITYNVALAETVHQDLVNNQGSQTTIHLRITVDDGTTTYTITREFLNMGVSEPFNIGEVFAATLKVQATGAATRAFAASA